MAQTEIRGTVITEKRKHKIPKPIELGEKPATYQPSKAEPEERHDMPGITAKQVRETFFRPFRFNKNR